jgi:hypothetical protein
MAGGANGPDTPIPSAKVDNSDPKFQLHPWITLLGSLGVVAAYVYLVSWYEVYTLSQKLGFDLTLYFEPSDYVKVFPLWGFVVMLSALVVGLLAVGIIELIKSVLVLQGNFHWWAPHGENIKRKVWVPLFVLTVLGFGAMLIPFMISEKIAGDQYQTIKTSGISTCYRKGASPAKGRVIFQLDHYALILTDQAALAIPQSNIEWIETPLPVPSTQEANKSIPSSPSPAPRIPLRGRPEPSSTHLWQPSTVPTP